MTSAAEYICCCEQVFGCWCDQDKIQQLIAKVRADERAKVIAESVAITKATKATKGGNA